MLSSCLINLYKLSKILHKCFLLKYSDEVCGGYLWSQHKRYVIIVKQKEAQSTDLIVDMQLQNIAAR